MPTTIDLTRLPEVTNDKFYPLYNNKDRYLVLVGGGGSGKSHFTAQKLSVRTLGRKKHRFLVVRKVAKTLRESCFALITGNIAEWGMTDLFEINKTDMRIKCKLNGNELLFAGLDDVEKLKSIANITGIWIEEASEITPEDFRQLDIRLRGKWSDAYKQIILTFNPIYKGHWLEKEFIGPDWTAKRANCTVLHSTYKDNRFLDPEQKEVLEAFKDIDPYYYMVYCLGEFGSIGGTIFPAQIVTERISYLRNLKPLKRGFFTYDYKAQMIDDRSIRWVDDWETGVITIYEEPVKGFPYVGGGDTAGDGSDNFVGQFLNNITGNQAAVLKHRTDEDLYARQMYCLGRYYNDALIGVETNFSTFPVKELRRLGYYRQYRREVLDQISKDRQYKDGFQTTKLSRPIIIANLVKTVREHPEIFNDIGTLEEMLTFVRNEKGKAAAQEGQHDDLIMGLAIAHFIREQQTDIAEVEREDTRQYPEEAWMYEEEGESWFD